MKYAQFRAFLCCFLPCTQHITTTSGWHWGCGSHTYECPTLPAALPLLLAA